MSAVASKAPAAPANAGWRIVGGALVIAAGALAAYRGSWGGPFVLDDFFTIVDNPSIRQLRPILPVLHPPADAGSAGRPLLNLSYALNYAWGGVSVRGYHVFNLGIHLLAGWTLFGLARRTLLRPVLAGRFGPAALPLGVAVAAIWTVHPLLTESVTYLSQRAESMMGLFYLLTLYGFVRSVEGDREAKGEAEARRPPLRARSGGRLASVSTRWATLSVLACLFGIATKEAMVTAPVIVFLYDVTFVSGTFSLAWRRHGRFYLALAATWIPLGWLLRGLQQRSVGFGQGVGAWDYGLTECGAIVRYLKLSFWPHPLVFDYGMGVPPRGGAVWSEATAVGLLVVASLAAWRRFRPAGFASGWVWVILAPTSSLIPIFGQPVAENRMYLPLAGIVALVVVGAYAWLARWSFVLFSGLAVVLVFATAARNQTYASAVALWTDTVRQRPDNARAQDALANALLAEGHRQEAIDHYRQALRGGPSAATPYYAAVIHFNLGKALRAVGRKDEALEQFQAALALNPGSSEAHNSLGICLYEKGQTAEAIRQFAEAVRLKPDNGEARGNLEALRRAAPPDPSQGPPDRSR